MQRFIGKENLVGKESFIIVCSRLHRL